MTWSDLLEFLDAPSALFYCGFKASDIGQCQYKICDDTVRPRNFLGADNEDEIEAILSDREGHSLHEFIDDDEPLRSIIDFDLPVKVYNSIEPKLTRKEILDTPNCAFRDVCLKVFSEWNSSSDVKKIFLHISTTGMRLKNIAQVAVFTELVRKKLPASL